MIIDFYNRNGGGGSVPIATRDTAGIVKVGSGLTIDSGGTLSTEGGGTSDIKLIDFDALSQSALTALYTELNTAFSGVTKLDTSGYKFMKTITNDNSYGSMEVYLSKIESSSIMFGGVTAKEHSWFVYSFNLNSDGTFTNVALDNYPSNYFQRKLTAGTGIEITSANTINCTVTGGTGGKTDYFLNSMTQAERLELFSTLSAITEDAGGWGNENLDDIADINRQFNFYVSLETDEYYGWAPVYYARRDSAQKFVLTGIAVKRDSGANFIAITAEIPNDGSLNVSTSSSS